MNKNQKAIYYKNNLVILSNNLSSRKLKGYYSFWVNYYMMLVLLRMQRKIWSAKGLHRLLFVPLRLLVIIEEKSELIREIFFTQQKI